MSRHYKYEATESNRLGDCLTLLYSEVSRWTSVKEGTEAETLAAWQKTCCILEMT